jgi:murein DD-endopeptidase
MRMSARWAVVLGACLAWPVLAADERESFDLQVPLAPAPVVVDGRARLFYELHLRNFSRQPLAPQWVEVLDDEGVALARFEGEALAARLAPAVPGGEAPAGAVAPGSGAVLYVELEVAPDAVPAALRHRIGYRVEDAAATIAEVTGGDTVADARPAVVLGPPLRGGPWAAVFHPGWARGHRRVFYAVEGRAVLPGRFAIDFVKLDQAGRIAEGDADVIRNAHGYGEPVLAVADATVVALRDDYPEAERISGNGRHPLSDGSGNYVMLDLGDGRHAVYEHLRPGSVRVAPGQRVRRGEVVGEVGLSGSGGWPHLHFHVADAPSLLGAEGLPFALDRFVALGRYLDVEDLGSKPWTQEAATERRDERPADNSVVAFPEHAFAGEAGPSARAVQK